jgi:transcriptional regulator with XRE-family HTH domain
VNTNSDQLVLETARVIRRRREFLHISQYKLAALCKLPRNGVGGVERGEESLRITTLSRIAAMLGALPSKILELAENNIRQPSKEIDYSAFKNFNYPDRIDPKRLITAVASVLQEQRVMQGISEIRLAKMAGLNRRYVSIYEDIGHDISLESLNRLASALEMRTSKILALAERSLRDKKNLVPKKAPKASAYNVVEMVGVVISILNDERKFQSMTQLELSQRSGFFQQDISDIENHRHNISLRDVFKLAAALEVPASRLMVLAEKEMERREIARLAKKSTKKQKK